MYVYTHTHAEIHTHTHTHTHIYVHIYKYVHIYLYAHVHTHAHTHFHTHTYIHEHTYAHTRACASKHTQLNYDVASSRKCKYAHIVSIKVYYETFIVYHSVDVCVYNVRWRNIRLLAYTSMTSSEL